MQPRKIENSVDASQDVLFRDELAKRSRDEQLQLVPFLATQHAVPQTWFGASESSASDFFNSPIVHLLRHSLDFTAYKDRKPVATALKDIYRAPDAVAAEKALAAFEAGEWGRRYAAIGQSWRRAWSEVVPFYAFPEDVRKIVYTTNAIEALNSKLRRAVRARGHFPTDDAALKLLFLVLNRSEKEWKMPPREWAMAKAQFAVLFGERFTRAMA